MSRQWTPHSDEQSAFTPFTRHLNDSPLRRRIEQSNLSAHDVDAAAMLSALSTGPTREGDQRPRAHTEPSVRQPMWAPQARYSAPPWSPPLVLVPPQRARADAVSSGSGSGNGNTQRRQVPAPSGQPCPNCGVLVSTLWRSCALRSGSHYLCNACGLRYKKGKFCPLCTRVYYDADTHQGGFLQCQQCQGWTHKRCLAEQGRVALLEETSPFAPRKPFVCARCEDGAGNM